MKKLIPWVALLALLALPTHTFAQSRPRTLEEEVVPDWFVRDAAGLPVRWLARMQRCLATVPLRFNTHLFPRSLAEHVPENPAEVMSAKEVGEPPLVLATAVFLALKRAVRASRIERGLDALFALDAPATVQAVQRACELNLSE